MILQCGCFVAGTDTGVGKTFVTAALVAAMRARGISAWPCKPVQTGSVRRRSPDLDFSLRTNDLEADGGWYEYLSPVRLRLAASPHLAAREEGKTVRLPELSRALQAIRSAGGFPVVEGVGGLLVPFNNRQTQLDWMQITRLPVVLVARAGLGTLNHTLLSVHALDSAGLELALVVVSSATPKRGRIERDNLAMLRSALTCPVAAFPYLPHPAPTALLAAGRALLRAARE